MTRTGVALALLGLLGAAAPLDRVSGAEVLIDYFEDGDDLGCERFECP